MSNWVLWYLIYKDDLYKLFLYYKQNQSIGKYNFLFFILVLIRIFIFYFLFFNVDVLLSIFQKKFIYILEHPTGSWFETP